MHLLGFWFKLLDGNSDMAEKESSTKKNSLVQKEGKPSTLELVNVTFPSEDKSIEVPSGASVLDAAIAAGVFINSVCGGMGRCGKCKIIAKGSFEADKSELISEEEKKIGMSLACTTKVMGDTEIEIPSSSKVDIHQILTRADLVHVEKTNPLINNYHLQMKKPTLDDNVSDFNRLCHRRYYCTRFCITQAPRPIKRE
jgi:uncharacterized 2Fe-2S/4Fe-4S cluster protein (DUF4445 family)